MQNASVVSQNTVDGTRGCHFSKVILKIRFPIGYLKSNIEKKLGVFA
jgi:hypothetical protein